MHIFSDDFNAIVTKVVRKKDLDSVQMMGFICGFLPRNEWFLMSQWGTPHTSVPYIWVMWHSMRKEMSKRRARVWAARPESPDICLANSLNLKPLNNINRFFKAAFLQLYVNNACQYFTFIYLRPPAGRQYGMSISQQPLNRSLPNFQQLLLMLNEGKVESFSSFAYG